jgi:hypothetical protein
MTGPDDLDAPRAGDTGKAELYRVRDDGRLADGRHATDDFDPPVLRGLVVAKGVERDTHVRERLPPRDDQLSRRWRVNHEGDGVGPLEVEKAT